MMRVTVQRHDAASHCDVTLRSSRCYGRTDVLTEIFRDGDQEIFTAVTRVRGFLDFDAKAMS